MLAVVALALGLAIGLLTGGKLSNLRHAQVPGAEWMVGLFLAQALFRGPLLAYVPKTVAIAVWGACSLALFVLLVWRLDLPPLLLSAAGVAGNMLVVLLNAGMPVKAPASYDPTMVARSIERSAGFYVAFNEGTMLWWLGDVVPVGGGLASIGDILLVLGTAWLVAVLTRGTKAECDTQPAV